MLSRSWQHAVFVVSTLVALAVLASGPRVVAVDGETPPRKQTKKEKAPPADPEQKDKEGAEPAEKGGDEAKSAPGEKDGGKEKGKTAVDTTLPPLEKLIEWNAAELFGGKAKLSGERLEVVFDRDQQMQEGFDGKGIIDSVSEEMKGANRKFIIMDKPKDGPEILYPALAAVGMGEGTWVSRFPLAGNTWVEFGMRVPNLIGKESNLKVRVNWQKEKGSGYETSFCQTISLLSGGQPKGAKKTALKEFLGPAMDWFPRNQKTTLKMAFGLRDGRCIAMIKGKETVSTPKVIDKGGRVAFIYNKLLWTIHDLRITGTLDRAWCKKRIEELKKEGKLRLQPPPPQIDALPPAPGG